MHPQKCINNNNKGWVTSAWKSRQLLKCTSQFTNLMIHYTSPKMFNFHIDKRKKLSSSFLLLTWCQFHQHSTFRFYTCTSRKRQKILLSHQYPFTLVGFAGINAARRTLMKLSPLSGSWENLN